MLQKLKGKRAYFLLTALMLFLAGCAQEPSPINPVGKTGQEQLNLMTFALGIMLLVVVVVFSIAIYVLVNFRAKKGDKTIPKQIEGNHKLEIIWTSIPIVLLIILMIPTVGYTFKHDQNLSNDPDAVKIQVVGHQFWWEFNYPELGIYSAQDMVMPVGKKISVELVTADVNHSFWIPALGGKKDLTAGLTNYMHLEPMEVGVFKGKCAELCGPAHALMDFKAVVLTEEEFDAWVADMLEGPPSAEVVAAEDVAAGEELYKANCISCHAVAPDQRSVVAPHMNGFAEREVLAGYLPMTEENIKEWIKAPAELKPGATMPGFAHLSDEELDQLTKYLLQLK